MNWKRSALVACVTLATCSGLVAETPVFRVVRSPAAGSNLLQNGGFELVESQSVAGWSRARNGYTTAAGSGRNGSRALVAVNSRPDEWTGASQTMVLNRTNSAPLIVRGWSKAEAVSGGSDSGYSVYVDLRYTDGTPSWGHTANFKTGTHDWELRQVTIVPEKPVQSLTVHCLLRDHSGSAWFDDISVEEVGGGAEACAFQGAPILRERRSPVRAAGQGMEHKTGDGLSLRVAEDSLVGLSIDAEQLPIDPQPLFMARDVAADSDFLPFTRGECDSLGLKLTATWQEASNHIAIEGKVTDLRQKDRAITLVFGLPFDAQGWQWGEDIRHQRSVAGFQDFANLVSVECGAAGTMALYPLAPIWTNQAGLAIGIDTDRPAVYRLGYHAGARLLYVAYDVGLVPDSEKFPSAAEFRFVLFKFDPTWGFRAAFDKYMKIFPAAFQVRAKEQGIWMPFTDVSKVQGWEDFGFKFHEGNNNVPWDDAHDVLSFRYTEPMTWWMRMDKSVPRTIADAIRLRAQLAADSPDPSLRRLAQASIVAEMRDDAGEPRVIFRNEPWCNGAVWSLNPNPALRPRPGGSASDAETPNGATIHWNEKLREELYGDRARGHLDGEYLDSLEGYVTAELNYRRDHFRQTTVPLCFSGDTKVPALFKGLAVYEFTHRISTDVHAMGKLMFANSVPYRFTFLCPWLDVMGTETDWLRAGKYEPASDRAMSLWRTMSGAKPYLLLMNTDYDAFTPELVERYFQRSLFYGVYPSMFSHNAAENPYWQNPKWHDRDRALFQKYQPMIRRVAESGWQPVTGARCDNPSIYVERFGPGADSMFLTVFNDTNLPQKGRLTCDLAGLGVAATVNPRELLSGQNVEAGGTIEVSLEPQEVKVFELPVGAAGVGRR